MPSEDVAKLVLQVLGVVIGGGILQQVVLPLLRRRSELRKTNTDSDSVVVTAANNQVMRMEHELERVADELITVKKELSDERTAGAARIAELQRENIQALTDCQERSNRVLGQFQSENDRLNKMVTKLQLDLSRANAQVAVLKAQGKDNSSGTSA